jgi:hypothetical protein
VVRFNATTLWHSDAAEWAPSTASFATFAHFWMSASTPLATLERTFQNRRFVPLTTL